MKYDTTIKNKLNIKSLDKVKALVDRLNKLNLNQLTELFNIEVIDFEVDILDMAYQIDSESLENVPEYIELEFNILVNNNLYGFQSTECYNSSNTYRITPLSIFETALAKKMYGTLFVFKYIHYFEPDLDKDVLDNNMVDNIIKTIGNECTNNLTASYLIFPSWESPLYMYTNSLVNPDFIDSSIEDYISIYKKYYDLNELTIENVKNFNKEITELDYLDIIHYNHEDFVELDEDEEDYDEEYESDTIDNICNVRCPKHFFSLFTFHPNNLGYFDFCLGSQNGINVKYTESIMYGDIMGYIKSILYTFQYVNTKSTIETERSSLNTYLDTFLDIHKLFDNFFVNNFKNMISFYYNNSRNNTLDDEILDLFKKFLNIDDNIHPFNHECACFTCISFRSAIVEGLKYDPRKIVFDKYPLFTLEEFTKLINGLQKYDVDVLDNTIAIIKDIHYGDVKLRAVNKNYGDLNQYTKFLTTNFELYRSFNINGINYNLQLEDYILRYIYSLFVYDVNLSSRKVFISKFATVNSLICSSVMSSFIITNDGHVATPSYPELSKHKFTLRRAIMDLEDLYKRIYYYSGDLSKSIDDLKTYFANRKWGLCLIDNNHFDNFNINYYFDNSDANLYNTKLFEIFDI